MHHERLKFFVTAPCKISVWSPDQWVIVTQAEASDWQLWHTLDYYKPEPTSKSKL